VELDAAEGAAGAQQAVFELGRAVGVVERGARGAHPGQHAQIGDRVCAGQPPLGGIQQDRLRSQDLLQLGRAGQAALGHVIISSAGSG
jgi:hypothetical protein